MYNEKSIYKRINFPCTLEEECLSYSVTDIQQSFCLSTISKIRVLHQDQDTLIEHLSPIFSNRAVKCTVIRAPDCNFIVGQGVEFQDL